MLERSWHNGQDSNLQGYSTAFEATRNTVENVSSIQTWIPQCIQHAYTAWSMNDLYVLLMSLWRVCQINLAQLCCDVTGHLLTVFWQKGDNSARTYSGRNGGAGLQNIAVCTEACLITLGPETLTWPCIMEEAADLATLLGPGLAGCYIQVYYTVTSLDRLLVSLDRVHCAVRVYV